MNNGFWIFSLMALTENGTCYMTCWGQQRKFLLSRNCMRWRCGAWLPYPRPCPSARLRDDHFEPAFTPLWGGQRCLSWAALLSDGQWSQKTMQREWDMGKHEMFHPDSTLGYHSWEAQVMDLLPQRSCIQTQRAGWKEWKNEWAGQRLVFVKNNSKGFANFINLLISGPSYKPISYKDPVPVSWKTTSSKPQHLPRAKHRIQKQRRIHTRSQEIFPRASSLPGVFYKPYVGPKACFSAMVLSLFPSHDPFVQP